MAWTPPSLPNSIVLLGGVDDEAMLTAEIVPGFEKWSSFHLFFVTGGGTFALRHSGLMSCGIPDDDTIVMTGGGWTFKHNFVTRWVQLKNQTITYMAQRSNHHNHDTRILQSKPSNITLRDGFLRKKMLSFRFCPNYRPPPPNLDNLYNFFPTSKFKI